MEEGLVIQENSSDLMQYLIQDLLDFAQLRAGKFRKNRVTFNIVEAVEKVMSI